MLFGRTIQIVGLIISSCLMQAGFAQDYRYALLELDAPHPDRQWDGAGDISSNGDVAGGSINNQNFNRATLWFAEGGFLDLGTLGGERSGASGLNDSGHVCGSAAHEPGNSGVRAFLWRHAKMVDLGTLGGRDSVARAVNNLGQVVGQSAYEPGTFTPMRAFLWENGVMSALPSANPERPPAAAWDINDLGEIVGEGLNADWEGVGLLWRDGQVFDLGSLAGRGSAAYAINDLGHIAGSSETRTSRHAVVWIDGQIIDIHTLGPDWFSVARDINNLDEVVGFAAGQPGYLAFIRRPNEPMRLLNQLVPPNLRLEWRIWDARAINDAGQIGAVAVMDSQPTNSWALLLSPVYPTLALAAPQPGRAGEANRLRVTGCTPGARVTFLYSRNGGGARIPGCDLQQNALQLDSPTVIGAAIADSNGVATITRTVPPVARNQTILFQAVGQNECAISQLVVHQFE